MKTMNCKELGGGCDQEFHANSFDEMAELSKNHCMGMIEKKDEVHLKGMHEMQELMNKPGAMKEWFENKRKEFESLPES